MNKLINSGFILLLFKSQGGPYGNPLCILNFCSLIILMMEFITKFRSRNKTLAALYKLFFKPETLLILSILIFCTILNRQSKCESETGSFLFSVMTSQWARRWLYSWQVSRLKSTWEIHKMSSRLSRTWMWTVICLTESVAVGAKTSGWVTFSNHTCVHPGWMSISYGILIFKPSGPMNQWYCPKNVWFGLWYNPRPNVIALHRFRAYSEWDSNPRLWVFLARKQTCWATMLSGLGGKEWLTCL